MIELNFLAFCVTVIALTAIAFGKDDIAGKALDSLNKVNQDIIHHITARMPKRLKD